MKVLEKDEVVKEVKPEVKEVKPEVKEVKPEVKPMADMSKLGKLSSGIQNVITSGDYALAEVVAVLDIIKTEYQMHAFLEHQAKASQQRIQNVTDPNLIKQMMSKKP